MNLSSLNDLPLPVAAVSYALLGFKIFPLKPGTKEPAIPHGHKEASDDVSKIAFWWDLNPNYNIGLSVPFDALVLDLDNKPNRRGEPQDGWRSYLDAGGDPAPFLSWPVQNTPSGGSHIYVEGPQCIGFHNFAGRGSAGGLDMRAGSGYIAVAPSRTYQGVYEWVDMDVDPLTPLPPNLLGVLRDWRKNQIEHQRSRDASLPPPTDMFFWDVDIRIDSLGADYAAFLRDGADITGDRSRDAYHACLRAFSLGWSLADMARIGPDTILATFGAESPHNAPDPWAWAVRYVVKPAWDAWQLTQKKTGAWEAPVSSLAGPSEVVQRQPDSVKEPTTLDLWSLLENRARALPPEDFQATKQFALEVVSSGIELSAQKALWRLAKASSRFSVDILETIASEALSARREASRRPTDVVAEVYVRAQGRILNPKTGNLVSKDAFLTAKAREHGGDMAETANAWLLGAEAACPVAEDMTYHPGKPHGLITREDGTVLFNLYRGPSIQPRGRGSAEEVRPWLDLLGYLQLEGGQPEEGMLLDHMAHIIQKPDEKINHGVILGSQHTGIGKDSFLLPFLRSVGMHNVTTIHGDDLYRQFTDYRKGKLVVINEIGHGDRKEKQAIYERMKPDLASPPEFLRIEEKNLRPYTQPNLLQVFGMTNHRLGVYADPADRRWLLLWCEGEAPKAELTQAWESWFDQYHAWLEGGGVEAVYAYLLKRDIRHFNPKARPARTKWLEEVIMFGRDPLEVWLMESIAGREGIWQSDIVATEEIRKVLEGGEAFLNLGGKWISPKRLADALISVGAISSKKGIRARAAWIIRNHAQVQAAIKANGPQAYRYASRPCKVRASNGLGKESAQPPGKS